MLDDRAVKVQCLSAVPRKKSDKTAKEVVAGNPVAGFVEIEVRAIDGTTDGYMTMEVLSEGTLTSEENGYCYAELTSEQARKLSRTLSELFPESEK
jgi:hypothetical protein